MHSCSMLDTLRAWNWSGRTCYIEGNDRYDRYVHYIRGGFLIHAIMENFQIPSSVLIHNSFGIYTVFSASCERRTHADHFRLFFFSTTQRNNIEYSQASAQSFLISVITRLNNSTGDGAPKASSLRNSISLVHDSSGDSVWLVAFTVLRKKSSPISAPNSPLFPIPVLHGPSSR